MTILIFLGSLIGAMALGVPIAFSLLLCGAALMWHLNMFDAQILAQNVINGADSFPLLAVPFFMLAGEIMNAGGLSRRIVNFAHGAGRPRQAAAWATWPSSPPSSWPRCRARRWPTPRRWPPCCCR
jgi:TRAP-type mannitol/chloroaromatic compound transport system permease large subunit